MATLHIVNRPLALESCLELAAADDPVLLIEDGVYAALLPQSRELLMLDADAQVRGVKERLQAGVISIGYAEFVDLAAEHSPLVSWN